MGRSAPVLVASRRLVCLHRGGGGLACVADAIGIDRAYRGRSRIHVERSRRGPAPPARRLTLRSDRYIVIYRRHTEGGPACTTPSTGTSSSRSTARRSAASSRGATWPATAG